ncbi:hypothetical protein [Saccharomonospora viridis]
MSAQLSEAPEALQEGEQSFVAPGYIADQLGQEVSVEGRVSPQVG